MRTPNLVGRWMSALIVLSAMSCGGKKPMAVIDPMSDVSGHWQLNDSLSDNAADKIAAALPARDRPDGGSQGGVGRRGGGGFGGGRGGRGGMRGGGGGGGPMDSQEMARRRARADLTIDLARDVSEDLDVHVTPGAVRFISHGLLDTLALNTDGGKQKTKIPQGDDEVQITTRATWTDGWLVVTRDVDGGGKLTLTYLRATDGRHLYVVTQLEMPRGGPIQFRNVYDPATGN